MAKVPAHADDVLVDQSEPDPAARCLDCRYEWRSQVMLEGLRLLGTCPKCGGELAFADAEPAHETAESQKMDQRAPHLVLGVPRR